MKWQEWKPCVEVRDGCGYEDLPVTLRQRRLRWFGHVRKAEGSLFNVAEEVKVGC